jgi:hypothetical protein
MPSRNSKSECSQVLASPMPSAGLVVEDITGLIDTDDDDRHQLSSLCQFNSI